MNPEAPVFMEVWTGDSWQTAGGGSYGVSSGKQAVVGAASMQSAFTICQPHLWRAQSSDPEGTTYYTETVYFDNDYC